MVRALLIALLMTLYLASYAQEQHLIYDYNIPGTDTVWVFKPKNYDESRNYPIVYLLHGYAGNYRQWDKIMKGQNYADTYDMVIVCPDAFFNSWYINSPNLENSQFVDFFFKKLMPAIEDKYNIDVKSRFITGLSMGGHGAFHLFLNNPEFFLAAGSTSGVLDLRGSSEAYQLRDHLGEMNDNKNLWFAFSALGNIDKFKKAGKEIIFDCGTEDPFYGSNKIFYEKCLENKIPVTFISRPGKHNAEYWKESIRYHFEFFKHKISPP